MLLRGDDGGVAIPTTRPASIRAPIRAPGGNDERPAGAEAPTGRKRRGAGQRTRITTFLSFDFLV